MRVLITSSGVYFMTHLHAGLDHVKWSVAEYGRSSSNDSEQSGERLGNRLVDVVLAAIQLFQRLHHGEPYRLVRALLHHRRR